MTMHMRCSTKGLHEQVHLCCICMQGGGGGAVILHRTALNLLYYLNLEGPLAAQKHCAMRYSALLHLYTIK